MSEIVLVPTFNREELLWLCLEAIRREDPKITIRVYSDRGADSDDLRDIQRAFETELVIRGNHRYYGNSFNLLNAMRIALREDAELSIVHLIEDDTILHPGYFTWARLKLSTKQYACVCARISEVPNWYESPCVSWDADHLARALEHLVPNYLDGQTREQMQKVLDAEMFPKSRYLRGGAEQDGFFLRVIEEHGWRTLFPNTALASHVGFWGYNRPPGHKRPTGSLQERVEFCRQFLNDLDRRRQMFGHRIANAEWGGMKGL